jgi:hypothetical protein
MTTCGAENASHRTRARKEMFSRHAKTAVMALNLVNDTLIKRLNRISAAIDKEENNEELEIREMTRLFDVAVKIERVSRGEPAEGGEINDPLQDLLDEFRKQYDRLPKEPDDPA